MSANQKTFAELIAELASAMESLSPPMQTECRLHPDDWEEMKRSSIKAHSPISSFCSLDVVLDPEAPRLPRLTAPAITTPVTLADFHRSVEADYRAQMQSEDDDDDLI